MKLLRGLPVILLLLVGLTLWTPAASGAAECHILPGGTLGDAEPAPVPDRAGSPTDQGPGAKGNNPTSGGLPKRVDLRSPSMSSNRNYYFAIKRGRLYVKPNYERTGRNGKWQHVPAPDCLEGDIKSIDADDDELIAINSARQIFGMDQALSIPSRFNWTSRWGFPFWSGDGFTIPEDAVAWAWTVISPRESEYWTDPAENRHEVGEGKVSHVLSLRKDRRRITMNDPWLPRDRSYEICTPRRGTFKVRNIAASGSVVFVIGANGDMYTRLWDFDIAGLDKTFFQYAYEDQRGLENPAIQLPGDHWVQQPKIPGRITDRISITTVGRGTDHRTLRVEGRNARGVPGFWQKDLYVLNRGSSGWKFVKTPKARITGKAIANPRGDTSARDAGAVEGHRFTLNGGSYTAEIPDFNVYCNLSLLRIGPEGGEKIDLRLHIDDTVRVFERERSIDGVPRRFVATIEVTDQAREAAAGNPAATMFIDGVLGGRQFTTVNADVTTSSLEFQTLGLTFDGAGRQGGACIPDPGFSRLDLQANRRRLKFEFETTTESPADIVIRRVRTGGKKVKGTVAARITRTGSFTWTDRRRKSRINGIYKVTVRSMGLGGRLDHRSYRVKRTGGKYRVLGESTGPGNCNPKTGS